MNLIKSRLLEKIKELKGKNVTIQDIDGILFPYFLKLADEKTQQAYNDLIVECIPF